MSACPVSLVEPVVEVLTRRRVEPAPLLSPSDPVIAPSLLDMLATVPDPRDPRGVRYRLAGLLAIMILATAAGMRSVAGIATWTRTAPAEVLAQLGIGSRRPSEKTLRMVMARLDAADLDRRLGDYFAAIAAGTALEEGRKLVRLPTLQRTS